MGLGGEATQGLLATHPHVDAIFFGNDDLAHGALLEVARIGIKIPEQISILGFNDLPSSEFMVPRLSSIRTPREAIGRRAAEQMLTLMAGNKVQQPVQDMGFELMLRESTWSSPPSGKNCPLALPPPPAPSLRPFKNGCLVTGTVIALLIVITF